MSQPPASDPPAATKAFGVSLRKVENPPPAPVPEIETRPEFSLVSLRAVPSARRRASNMGLRKSRQLGQSEVVQVELLPSDMYGTKPAITGYGEAPKQVEVFGDDDDVFIEAAEIEQVELNLEAEVGGHLNMDLSAEYQKPVVERAIAYSKKHRPHKPNGDEWGLWSTRTGRFTATKGAEGRCEKISDPFCEGKRSELVAYGPGISSYFKWLKVMGGYFVFLSVMDLPRVIVNIFGGSEFITSPFPFAMTTLGNLFIQTTTLANGTVVGNTDTYNLRLAILQCDSNPANCELKRSSMLLYYSIWDAACMTTMLIAIQIIGYWVRQEGNHFRSNVPKIEDFSIECNVPEGSTARSLAEHFETLTKDEVYDVQIVESTGDAISLVVERGRKLKALARLDARIKMMTKRGYPETRIDRYVKRFEKLKVKIAAIDEKAQKRAEKGLPLMAYVTFNTKFGKRACLESYDVMSWCGQPKRLMYHGEQKMVVKSAPPPSTLLWENQEIPTHFRLMRGCMSLIMLASLLLITALLSFYAQQNNFINQIVSLGAGDANDRCGYASYSLQQGSTMAQASGQLECFCQSLSISPPANNSAAFLFVPGGACAAFFVSAISLWGEQVGFSLVLVVINIIIYRVTLFAAEFQRFKSVLSREFAILRVIFIFTFLNVALIILIVNVNWGPLVGDSSYQNIVINNVTLTGLGNYVDLTAQWYNRVGVELFFISIFNIFLPHLFPLINFLRHTIRRNYFSSFVVSQQVLNEMYIGEDFLLSLRLGQTLQIIFFTLLYSSGIPVLNWTCMLTFVLSYWVDKLYFCKIVRTPPQFDESLQLWTTYTIEWAVFAHCLFGFWAYTSPRMFPLTQAQINLAILSVIPGSATGTNSSALNFNDNSIDFWDELSFRFNRGDGTIIILLPALVIVAWKLLTYVGREVSYVRRPVHLLLNGLRSLFGREQRTHKSVRGEFYLDDDSFTEALKSDRVVGTISYNILANPAYQRLFFMQGGVDRPEKNNGGDSASGDIESAPAGANDDVESVTSSDAGRAMASHGSFQSLQDALNLKRGAKAVDNITKHHMWGDDDGKSYVSNASVKSNTSKLYEKPKPKGGESEMGDKRGSKSSMASHGSKKEVALEQGGDTASVTSSKSTKSKAVSAPPSSVTARVESSDAPAVEGVEEAKAGQVAPEA